MGHRQKPIPYPPISRVDAALLGALFTAITIGLYLGTNLAAPDTLRVLGRDPWFVAFAAGTAGLGVIVAIGPNAKIERLTLAVLAVASLSRAASIYSLWIAKTTSLGSLLVGASLWILVCWFLVRGWHRRLLTVE